MGMFRMLETEFWDDPIVLEEMTPEERYLYIYLLTNKSTRQIGIYRISIKQIALHIGYPIETIQSLMDRFINHFKLIRYNLVTRELAIKNWGQYILQRGGKPVMDCMYSELKEVMDTSLIQYVAESYQKKDICRLYESFCKPVEAFFGNEASNEEASNTYVDPEGEKFDTASKHQTPINEQIEMEKENQTQSPKDSIVENPQEVEKPNLHEEDVQEIVEFWDNNGFGFSNINAKEQLLAWLDDSHFIHPKSIILKAMSIACAANKRILKYVIGILRNWENESLLTIEEVNSYLEKQKPVSKQQATAEVISGGRDIPREFELDLTAGEVK